MASRELSLLHPDMIPLIESWSESLPFPILIYCTVRDFAEQAELYSYGRTVDQIQSGVARLYALNLPTCAAALEGQIPRSGKRKTKALPGFSFHHFHMLDGRLGGLAVDFVPMLGGKPQWNDEELYREAGTAAESIGLTWSGSWKTMRETCHVQYDRGGTIEILPLIQGAYGEGV